MRAQHLFRLGHWLRARYLVMACSVLAAGCKMGPDYVRPDTTELEELRVRSEDSESLANLPWWELYQDPVLHRLVRTALEKNRDLRVAVARIQEARLVTKNVDSYSQPSLGVGASLDVTEGVTTEGAHVQSRPATLLIDMSYELDLWGRIRRSSEAAYAELLVTEETYRSIVLTLVAQVGSLYFTLLGLDDQLLVIGEAIKQREEAVEVVRSRFQGGFTNEVEYLQSKVQLHDAQAAAAGQRRAIVQTENALSLLLGLGPRSHARGRPLVEQVLPPKVPVGLASDIVRRRPDIRAAEHRLHAQTARIGVAKAARFPRFALTGPAGVTTNLMSPLVATFSANFGLEMAAALYNAGRNKRQVEIEVRRSEAQFAEYEQSILRAFAEVEDALVSIETFQLEIDARQLQSEAAIEATKLAWARYSGGMTTYLEVINVQNSELLSRVALSSARRAHFNAVISLYKALGGGWPESEKRDEHTKEIDEESKDKDAR